MSRKRPRITHTTLLTSSMRMRLHPTSILRFARVKSHLRAIKDIDRSPDAKVARAAFNLERAVFAFCSEVERSSCGSEVRVVAQRAIDMLDHLL